MPEADTIFRVGNYEYSFDGSGLSNLTDQMGYFIVQMREVGKGGWAPQKINTAQMLFLVYAMRQVSQSDKVEKYSAISAALADLASAASELNKYFSLMASSFDGEYFKQSLAPDGTIGVNLNQDLIKNTNNWTKDINTRFGLLDPASVKNVIKYYGNLLTAYSTLTTPENKAVLDKLNISIDTVPDCPLGPMTAEEFSNLLASSSLASPSGSVAVTAKNMSDSSWNAADKLRDQIYNFFLGYGVTASGEPSLMYLYDDNDNQVGVYRTKVVDVPPQSLSFTLTDGQIDLTDDANLANLAYYFLAKTNTGTETSNGIMLTAPTATNFRESYNNMMNKTNTSTQSVTQYTTRELSKLDSLQSMVDRNLNSVFDTFNDIARGY